MSVCVSFASAILVLAVLVGGPGSASAATPLYYLSLGDSLADGFQPTGVFIEGYADELLTALQATTPELQLVKLGCRRETTTTMIAGGAICDYSGSQLDAATAFLQANQDVVALITIDLGADDTLVACPSLPSVAPDPQCINNTLASIETNLPAILATLPQTAGPDVPILGMTYYDLCLAFRLQGQGGQVCAMDTFGHFLRFNDTLERLYKTAGAPVADVEGAFSSKNFRTTGVVPGVGSIPLNVARLCEWTWMCAAPPLAPDIHANTEGYGVIAEAFLNVLP